MPVDTLTQIVIPGLSAFIPLSIFSVGGLISLGVFKARINESANKIKEIETACETKQNKCQKNLLLKFDEVKELVKSLHNEQQKRIEIIDTKREVEKDDFYKEFRKISICLAKVEQALSDKRIVN